MHQRHQKPLKNMFQDSKKYIKMVKCVSKTVKKRNKKISWFCPISCPYPKAYKSQTAFEKLVKTSLPDTSKTHLDKKLISWCISCFLNDFNGFSWKNYFHASRSRCASFMNGAICSYYLRCEHHLLELEAKWMNQRGRRFSCWATPFGHSPGQEASEPNFPRTKPINLLDSTS